MPLTSHTTELTSAQASALRELLERENFEFQEKPHTLYAASKGKLNVAVYRKGPKVLLQGKDTEDFIRFYLEPEIIGEARLGYEEVNQPEMFEPHLGIDESGKGDFFGPLVIAGVYVEKESARALLDAGIRDSKRITSDARIRALAAKIRSTPGIVADVVAIGPESYNRLYEKFSNLNKLLAWGHARVIENLLEKVPACPRALSDQFANPRELQRALMERGRTIALEQRTKAESDLAVAAASILARERFIDWLDNNSEELGSALPRGASRPVTEVVDHLVRKHGPDILNKIAKTHFKIARPG